MALGWVAVTVFIAAIMGLKLSRWHKTYGQDPLHWYDVVAIVALVASMVTLIVARFLQ